MSIQKSDLEPGFLYKTNKNQDRALLYISDGNVIYATRGGNVHNEFNRSESDSLETFTEACCTKEGKIRPEELERIIVNTNAKRLLK